VSSTKSLLGPLDLDFLERTGLGAGLGMARSKDTGLCAAAITLGAVAKVFFTLDCLALTTCAGGVLRFPGPEEEDSIAFEDLPRSRSARFVGAGGSGMV
jgi:hypothetical protein